MGNEWEIEIFDYEGSGWISAESFEATPEEALIRLKGTRRQHKTIMAFRLIWRGND